MLPKLQRFVLISAITLLAALVVWPYHDGVLRFGLPMGLVAAWASLVLLARAGIARWVLFALPVLVAIPFCLPGKAYDASALRTAYVLEMKQLKGTRYLWGGEGRKGIDCSGLPRRALRNALLDDGWRRLNGRAFRDWAEQWWYDTSAKALSGGYRGFTRPVGVTGQLRDLDFTCLDPGDLAVTAFR